MSSPANCNARDVESFCSKHSRDSMQHSALVLDYGINYGMRMPLSCFLDNLVTSCLGSLEDRLCCNWPFRSWGRDRRCAHAITISFRAVPGTTNGNTSSSGEIGTSITVATSLFKPSLTAFENSSRDCALSP